MIFIFKLFIANLKYSDILENNRCLSGKWRFLMIFTHKKTVKALWAIILVSYGSVCQAMSGDQGKKTLSPWLFQFSDEDIAFLEKEARLAAQAAPTMADSVTSAIPITDSMVQSAVITNERDEAFAALVPQEIIHAASETSPNVPEIAIRHSIARGGAYLANLWLQAPGKQMLQPMYGCENTGDARFVQAIVDIIWYLYSEAIVCGQVFEEGTFVIKDPGLKLFNVLLQYVKYCDADWRTEKYTSECYAYCRASSHWKEYYAATGQEKLHHYGIYPNLPGVTPLPAQKQHIFFGLVNLSQELIFIKPENAGLSTAELGRHGYELVRGIVVKVAGTEYDDQETFRKERVPKKLRRKFIEKFPAEKAKIEGLGIQHMIKLGRSSDNPELQALTHVCCEQYDHIDMRVGREIIIIPEKLTTALCYGAAAMQ